MMPLKIDHLLTKAFTDEASDLHISVNSPPIYRMHGELTPYGDKLLTASDTDRMAKKILRHNWDACEKAGEFDFAYHIEHVARYRVNAFKQKGNISLAARVIPTKIPTIEKLEMP